MPRLRAVDCLDMSISKSRLRQYFLTLVVAIMATASAFLMAQDGAEPVAAPAAADEATSAVAKPAYGPDNPRQVRITSRIMSEKPRTML